MAFLGSFPSLSRFGRIGSSHGESLGKGFAGGLEALIGGKLEKLQSRERLKQHKEQGGLSPQESYIFEQLRSNPKAQSDFIKELDFSQGNQGGSPEEMYAQPNMMESLERGTSGNSQLDFLQKLTNSPQQQMGQLPQQQQMPQEML